MAELKRAIRDGRPCHYSLLARRTSSRWPVTRAASTWTSLAGHFGVTPQTIRKDLNHLCEQGLLQRYHGGAMLPLGRRQPRLRGAPPSGDGRPSGGSVRAARLIPNDCSLLINIGTTTEQVATALRAHTGLMVITNNINVVNILQGYTGIEVIVVGGVVRHADGGIVGEAAVDFIRQFKVDYAIVGSLRRSTRTVRCSTTTTAR